MTQGSRSSDVQVESFTSASRITRRSFEPSGDHAYDETPCFSSVRAHASPPRRSRTHTWLLAPSPRVAVKERKRPSGDHVGEPTDSPARVMGMASPPAEGAIHRRVSRFSSSRSVVATVYATHVPSGLSAGL